jgi:HK97 family phage prohead protease
MANSEIERRLTISDTSIEYRDIGNGEKRPVIVGYAAVFNSESRNLGGFVEVIHPGAFDSILATNPDVIGVYNHSKDKLLARSANGTLKLKPDSYGLRYEMGPLPRTQTAEEVVELVSGGYVTGSSFAFAVKNTPSERGDRWGMTSSGIRRREVLSVGKLEDVGPVVRPAFEAASVVVSRRAIEMALGDAYRPNQTMANAARKGLNACRGRDDVDQVLMSIAEHIVSREIVSVEEVEYLASVHERAVEARAEDWTGSPAWIEWKLAGGEAGAKWVEKRRAAAAEPAQIEAGDEERSQPEAPTAVSEGGQVVVEERADVNLKPSAGMASAARRGLKLHEEGKSGDGLKPETVARANKISARETLTEDHVREMNAWFARHESASKSPGWDTPGEEKPGFVAWLLWGGNAGQRWAASKVAQMEKRSEGEAEGVSPPKRALYKALEDVTEVYGAFPPTDVHYRGESPWLDKGMRCANCLFYEGGGGCEIVQGSVSPEGLCQLHIIPEVLMSEQRDGDAAVAEQEPAAPAPAQEAPAVPAETNSDPMEALMVKAAELNAAVLRTRLRTM